MVVLGGEARCIDCIDLAHHAPEAHEEGLREDPTSSEKGAFISKGTSK